MKVLVTGHLGYLGPVVIAALKDAGHRVVGLDVGYFRDCVDPALSCADADSEFCMDIRDVTVRELDGVDAIVHLAGLSNDPLGALAPRLTAEINHHATIRLARAARAGGVSRFVFASSCSIYGAGSDAAQALDENAAFNPQSAYAVSKVACERDLVALADDSFAPVFLRFATAFGLSPRMRFDLVLANLTAWARTTGIVKVLSDGTPWRPLVHIRDMTLAICCALSAPAGIVSGRAFNIGRADCNLQVSDIADVVCRQVGGSRLVVTGESGGDPRSYRVDFSRALSELPGFVPSWTIAAGCEEIDRWLVDGKLDVERFQSRYYVRLKQLVHLRSIGSLDATLRMRSAVGC
jgi:nucleoside-diphosphate-sugar epimerase